jgi:hypothetical protein
MKIYAWYSLPPTSPFPDENDLMTCFTVDETGKDRGIYLGYGEQQLKTKLIFEDELVFMGERDGKNWDKKLWNSVVFPLLQEKMPEDVKRAHQKADQITKLFYISPLTKKIEIMELDKNNTHTQICAITENGQAVTNYCIRQNFITLKFFIDEKSLRDTFIANDI